MWAPLTSLPCLWVWFAGCLPVCVWWVRQVVARSLVWPGASAVAVGKRWTVVYSGDAVKYRPAPYIVDSPPAIQPVRR